MGTLLIAQLTNPVPMLKSLRIAVTALSLTACVLLVALWVRSYFAADALLVSGRGGARNSIVVESMGGRMKLLSVPVSFEPEWGVVHESVVNEIATLSPWGWPPIDSLPNFQVVKSLNRLVSVIIIPHWFPVLIFATIAIVPWIHWSRRFSLRALLIATTLIAVVLGIVVAAR